MLKKAIPLAIVAISMFAVSCKKKDDKSDPQNQIKGKWRVDFYAEDLNDNNQIDDAEKEAETYLVEDVYFNEGGKGLSVSQETSSDPVDSTEFTYSLSSDAKTLTMTSDAFSFSYSVDELSSNRLTVSFSGFGDHKQWTSMKK